MATNVNNLWRRRKRKRREKHLDVSHRALKGAERCKACGDFTGGEMRLKCACKLDYPDPRPEVADGRIDPDEPGSMWTDAFW